MQTARPTATRAGFTLVELLVVVSIIGLLAAMLMPSLGRAKEFAYATRCRANLHQIWTACQDSPANRPMELPAATAWVGHVTERKTGGVLTCPKDSLGFDGDPGGLDGVFIKHVHFGQPLDVYLTDVLAPGAPLGQGVLIQVTVKDVSSAVKEVYLYGSNGLRITFGGTITIEAVPDPDWLNHNTPDTNSSTHKLMRGDDVLMDMLGRDNVVAASPAMVIVGRGNISYGMNNQIPPSGGRGGQVMLTDYVKSVIDVDGAGNYDDDLMDLLPVERHLGKVNVIRLDGSCQAVPPWQLDPAEGAWTR